VKLTFITIFPGLVEDFCKEALISRAIKNKKILVKTISPREFTTDVHQTVDDSPYGGGNCGMIMKAPPLISAIRKATGRKKSADTLIILLTPSKKIFNQKMAVKFANKYKHIIFVCGRYEGMDARVEKFVDLKLSIGEFVLMGGEVAALAILEATARLLPGVINHGESLIHEESYGQKFYLEYPKYTRPEVFEKMKVPKILLSGHHAKIEEWRKGKSATKK